MAFILNISIFPPHSLTLVVIGLHMFTSVSLSLVATSGSIRIKQTQPHLDSWIHHFFLLLGTLRVLLTVIL